MASMGLQGMGLGMGLGMALPRRHEMHILQGMGLARWIWQSTMAPRMAQVGLMGLHGSGHDSLASAMKMSTAWGWLSTNGPVGCSDMLG